ncbi:MAG: hypothetical protein WKF34_05380 [Pyrinomonadaceae bacterium]
MINTSTPKRLFAAMAIGAAVMLASGSLSEVSAQRDPFQKPSFMKVRKPVTASASSSSSKPVKAAPPPVNYGPPPVEARLEFFKGMRAEAAAAGLPLPKPTTVMTLSEIAVTGIYKTPRGWGATVEVTPIKLSYAVYPGEKFFDGQLVAVEENRLVFRKVTKVGEGKFVAAVENKPLRQYSIKSQLEGTAAAESGQSKTAEIASTPAPQAAAPVPGTIRSSRTSSNPFLSPVDEMSRQPETPVASSKDKIRTPAKKPIKLAKNTVPKN